jgi:hypothetical protein
MASLRSEVSTATRTYAAGPICLGLLYGVSAGLAVATLVIARTPPVISIVDHVERVLQPSFISVPVPVVVRVPMPTPNPRASELGLMLDVGKVSYVKLVDLGDGLRAEPMPKHGKARLVANEGSGAVIEAVADRDVPIAYRGWKDRKVIVDGTCEATVTGFAVVARVAGSPGFAGDDHAETWNVKDVLEYGNPVLAAQLDKCTGLYARDAALPPVIVPDEIVDEGLAKAARAMLIASPASKAQQKRWTESEGRDGKWYDQAPLETKVLRHPITGVTWVSVYGSLSEGCGGADANVWGLFRVSADRTLVPVEMRDLGELHSINRLIDVDGDGELELVGRPWLPLDLVLTSHDGRELDRVSERFYGCPC